MIDQLQQVNLFPVTTEDVLKNCLFALMCGLILSVVYRLIYRGANYSVTYVNSLVLLSLVASIVVIVIGNNVARAFGLVGALSIIRFRTVVRDTLDLVFIFIALAVGMACGVGLNGVAVIGTLAASGIIIALTFTHFSAPRRRQHLLQISYFSEKMDDVLFSRKLQNHARRVQLISMKNVGENGQMEAMYHLTLKNVGVAGALIQDLKQMEATKNVNLYFDEDDYNPPTL
jgi:uncharacterized membrane protein YhiD involved in acid resistance